MLKQVLQSVLESTKRKKNGEIFESPASILVSANQPRLRQACARGRTWQNKPWVSEQKMQMLVYSNCCCYRIPCVSTVSTHKLPHFFNVGMEVRITKQ